ncbi:hypothetical protein [Chromobacterium violaceum]|uniref:hypothetical protein n=1 Tax=Chromobacterium violaceum TaxID=536 RepID=UPI00194DE3C4|nr:hypothetical protein [Chromobacterium violaceum]QRO33957.1 hypothetical protein I6K04_04230 [Chromobacterium violaceum]QRQ16239.1 hypothetical protein I6K03_18500 [Chromobacterium violaceum]
MSDVRYGSTKGGSSATGAQPIPEHKIEYLGSYQVNQKHEIESPLKKSLDALEAAAARFATDAINDSNVRTSYQNNITRMARTVLEEVSAGTMTAKEGMEFSSKMRNKIMMEHRAVTSAHGLASAEQHKKTGKTSTDLLDKYAKRLFGKDFKALSPAEKNKVYYSIIESSAKSNDKFDIKAKRLKVIGKVGWIVTATLAAYSISQASNKEKETIRQGAVIGGGMLGGAAAGLLVSTICGPGAPVCAIAVMLAGSAAGGLAAESVADAFDDELEEFSKWKIQ